METCGIWERLGERIRRAREASGLSVREIERRSGVCFRTLYAYEHGETGGNIMLGKYIAICEVIGADPARLLAQATEDAQAAGPQRTERTTAKPRSGTGRACK